MKKLICKIFGHKWGVAYFNFGPQVSNCVRCGIHPYQ